MRIHGRSLQARACLPICTGATSTALASSAHDVMMFARSPTWVPSPMSSMSGATSRLQ